MAKEGLLNIKGFDYPNAYLRCTQPDLINGIIYYQIYPSKESRELDINNIIDNGFINIDINLYFNEDILKTADVSPWSQSYNIISLMEKYSHMINV